MSGARAERPGLREALDFCRAGGTLVVRRLELLLLGVPVLDDYAGTAAGLATWQAEWRVLSQG